MAGLIAVCVPTRGIVFTEVMQSVVENCAEYEWMLFTTIDEGLPDCMNNLVERALDAGAEWLWIVEEDTVPPKGVLDAMFNLDARYVACDYPVGASHTCFGFDPEDRSEILWTGFGCTLIHASVFETIEKPWFECNRNMVVVKRDGLDYFTSSPNTVNHRGGHDLSFAEKLKATGVARHGLPDMECRHLKMKAWNTAPTNKACHDIQPIPPIVHRWTDYIDDKPRCSIVIPCYNYAEYLPEAIESALAQTVRCEIIVVDDGSTDDTSLVALQYPIMLVKQEHLGLPAARNAGIRMARANQILPLDADDILEPWCVETMLKASTGGIVRARAHLFGNVEQEWLPGFDTTLGGFMEHNGAAACSLFPRAGWDAVGGYDETMIEGYEDWDLWVRLLHWGATLATVPTVCWRYRRHGASMVADTKMNHDTIYARMVAKWASRGITASTPQQYRVVPLVYPVALAVTIEHDGTTYPQGTRINHETAVAMKRAGLLTDPRIV